MASAFTATPNNSHSEYSPCYWMDEACAPGSEDFLKNQDGLGAKILTDSLLKL